MKKTILITGATDGIGLETAKLLGADGQSLLLHGRSPDKLDAANAVLPDTVETYLADLSDLSQVAALAESVRTNHRCIDVLINNAGVFKAANPLTPGGLDVRFIVNTIAPYLLTRRLLPIIPPSGRIINVSSAAQAPVDLKAMGGSRRLEDFAAYAQSKLAITIWTQELAAELKDGPAVIAVNPGSLLASKMVKEGFGVPGSDLHIGADVLFRMTLTEDVAAHTGQYFDNDTGRFAAPHPTARDQNAAKALMAALDASIANIHDS